MWDQLDLFTQPRHPVSVSELTRQIRNVLEHEPMFQDVWVEGEISNLSRASSGHVYLTLKDSGAQLGAVIWRGQAMGLRIPASGDQVIAHGRIGLYEQGGRYQFYIDSLEPAGRGALYLEYERLKQKLGEEGLFAAEHKRALPWMPKTIGVVTSPGAAALRDVVNVLSRRFPQVRVILSPTLVQGTNAPAMIVKAIRALNKRDDIDLIMVVRGGGSLEDLWAFNDEAVTREVYHSRYPVLSGIGHETDFSLVDFAADQRAPTPSAAAELAVPDFIELRLALKSEIQRMHQAMFTMLQQKQDSLVRYARHLDALAPTHRLLNAQQRLDDLGSRLHTLMSHRLDLARQHIAMLTARLDALNPEAVLGRGYSLVTDCSTGKVVSSTSQAIPNLEVTIRFVDGEVGAVIQDNQ